MSELNYKYDIAIDPGELDEELLRQPILATEYARELARVQKDVLGKAQLNFDLTKAKVDREVRRKPHLFGIDELKEVAVSGAVSEDKRYQEALEKLNQAKYECSVLKAAVNGIEHRKRSLEGLIKLYLGQYFAVPNAGKMLEGGKREMQGKRVDIQRRNLNKRRRHKK